jgi:hypothetical protein
MPSSSTAGTAYDPPDRSDRAVSGSPPRNAGAVSDEPTPLDAAMDLVLYAPLGLIVTVGEEIPKLAAKGRARVGNRLAVARMIGQFAVGQGRRELDRRMGAASRPTGPGGDAAPASGGPPPRRPQAPAPRSAPRATFDQETGAAGVPVGATPPRQGRTAPGGTPAGSSGAVADRRGPVATTAIRSEDSTTTAPTPTPAVNPAVTRPAGARAGTAPKRAVDQPPVDQPPVDQPAVARPAAGPGDKPAVAAAARAGEVPDVTSLAIPGYASLSASQVVQRLAGLSSDELAAVGLYEASSRGRRTILARVAQLQSR